MPEGISTVGDAKQGGALPKQWKAMVMSLLSAAERRSNDNTIVALVNRANLMVSGKATALNTSETVPGIKGYLSQDIIDEVEELAL